MSSSDVESLVAADLLEPAFPAGFADASRAVVSVAAELFAGVQRAVVGPDKVRTARDNAWAATLEDRARHEAREELSREVAAMVAARRARAAANQVPTTAHPARGARRRVSRSLTTTA
jgi:hypothetical protein